jgi:peroxin-10
MIGTRWLALRQPIVDLLVKAIYLMLTLGRAMQTLGEEYTDIVPRTSSSARLSRLASHGIVPSSAWLTSQKRVVTIFLLLAPTILTTSTVTNNIRGEASNSTILSRLRTRLANWLESPIGQSLAELNTIAFLYGGRYLEVGRRITGMKYVSLLLLSRAD